MDNWQFKMDNLKWTIEKQKDIALQVVLCVGLAKKRGRVGVNGWLVANLRRRMKTFSSRRASPFVKFQQPDRARGSIFFALIFCQLLYQDKSG